MEEFLEREGGKDGRLPIPEATKDVVLNAASHCEKREKSKSPVLIWRIISASACVLESHCGSPIDI